MTPDAARMALNKWGVHLLLDDGVSQWPEPVWAEHLDYARGIVGAEGYVLQLIRANDLDVAKWQRFFDEAARRRLNPVIRLATWQDRAAGHWVAPPADAGRSSYQQVAESFGRFLASMRIGRPLYVTVGNEPNRGDEWGGTPDPAAYARYLRDVSAALRSHLGERVVVLNGALDQYAPDTGGQAVNGFRAIDASGFLEGMHRADPAIWSSIDVWAAHTYPLGPFSESPAARDFRIDDVTLGGARLQVAPWPGLYNRGLNSYRWELYKLSELGVSRSFRVLITETGWRHRNSQQSSADSAGAVIGASDVANHLRRAFEGDPNLHGAEYTWTPWNLDADVVGVVIFALDGVPSRWGHTNLLDLAEDGSVIGLKRQFAPLLKP